MMSLATRNDYGTLYSLRVHKLKGITVLALIDLDKGLSITATPRTSSTGCAATVISRSRARASCIATPKGDGTN